VRFSAAHGKPTKFDGHAYIRIGESTTNLDNHPELEQKIWNNERNKNFEKGIAKQDLSLDEVLKLLDYDKYFQLTKQDLPTETNKFLEKLAQDKLVLIQNDGNYSITVL